MTQRPILARVPLGRDELVVTLAEGGKIDLRLWTDLNGTGVKLASRNGVTVAVADLPAVIDALQRALALDEVAS